MRFLSLTLVVAITLQLGTCAPAARAADPAAAEAAFNAGEQLAQEGKWAEACPKFLASIELDPQLGARLHLANCYEQIGKLASAWASWKEGLDLAKKKNDDRVATIEQRIAALEPRLPHLRIDVSHPEVALTVKRDDDAMPPATFGLALPVDAGPLTVRVLRGEQVLEGRPITAVEGQTTVVALDLKAIEAAHPLPKPPPVKLPPAVPPTPPLPAKPYNPTHRQVGIGLGATGLVATLIAGGLLIGAAAKKGEANAPGSCVEKLCTTQGHAAAETAARLATAGQWLGIVGIGVLGAGVAVFATAPSPPKANRSALARRLYPRAALLVPWLDFTAGGAALAGRW